MSFHFNVIGDEAWPPLRCDLAGYFNSTFMVGIICIQQRENRTRVPKNASPEAHVSRIACLSRAPGRPPPRPAPTSRNIGCSSVKGGMSPVTFARAAFRSLPNCTRRRPPRLTLGISPRWRRRQRVEREIPNAWIASSIVNRFARIAPIVPCQFHRLICLTPVHFLDADCAGIGRSNSVDDNTTFAVTRLAERQRGPFVPHAERE